MMHGRFKTSEMSSNDARVIVLGITLSPVHITYEQQNKIKIILCGFSWFQTLWPFFSFRYLAWLKRTGGKFNSPEFQEPALSLMSEGIQNFWWWAPPWWCSTVSDRRGTLGVPGIQKSHSSHSLGPGQRIGRPPCPVTVNSIYKNVEPNFTKLKIDF